MTVSHFPALKRTLVHVYMYCVYYIPLPHLNGNPYFYLSIYKNGGSVLLDVSIRLDHAKQLQHPIPERYLARFRISPRRM